MSPKTAKTHDDPGEDLEAKLLALFAETDAALAAEDLPLANERMGEAAQLTQATLMDPTALPASGLARVIARFRASQANAEKLEHALERRLADTGASGKAILAYRRRGAGRR